MVLVNALCLQYADVMMECEMDLRAARERAALSIADLAKLAGVNAAVIWRTEMARTQPRPLTRRKLSAALKVRPSAIQWPERQANERQLVSA